MGATAGAGMTKLVRVWHHVRLHGFPHRVLSRINNVCRS